MSRDRVADIAYASGILLAMVMLVVFGFFAYRDKIVSQNDFTYLWAGARTVVDGGDPYRPADWLGTVQRYGTTKAWEDVFGYPPWIALAATPLALLPVVIASGVWTFGGMTAAALAIRGLLRTFDPDPPVVHFLAGFALFASQPGIANVWSGQWTFVLLAVLTALVVAVHERRRAPLFAAFVLTTKPHLFLFSLPAVARAAAARWGSNYLAALAIPLTVVVAVGWFAFPGWLDAWRAQLFAQRLANQPPTTLANGLADLIGPLGAPLGAVLVLALVGAALAFQPRGDAFLAVWLAVSAATPIYSWSYDHLLLVPPLVIATAVLGRRSRIAATAFAGSSFAFFLLAPVLLYALADQRRNESFNILVPLVVAIACVTVLWPQRAEAEPASES